MQKKTLKIVLGVLVIAVGGVCILFPGKDVSDEKYVRIFHDKIERLSSMDDKFLDDEQFIYDEDFIDVYRSLPPIKADIASPLPILGWDVNRNGIRDDVERILILRYYEGDMKLMKQASLQFVRDAQVTIDDYLNHNNHWLMDDIRRLAEDRKCISDVLNYLDTYESHGIEPFDEINYITSVVYNNQERVNIYSYLVQQEALDLKSSIDKQNMNFCDFNIGDIKSSRDPGLIRIAATPSENVSTQEKEKSESNENFPIIQTDDFLAVED